MEDIAHKMEVDIYPNPVSDVINIKLPQTFDQSVQIEICNEIGSLVYTQKWQNDNQQSLQLDCFAELTDGFYFIKIFDKEDIYSGKLIKVY